MTNPATSSAPAGESRQLEDLLADLPPPPDEAALLPELHQAVAGGAGPVVVIDDDPTGTQTVSDTRVLLDWDTADLEGALSSSEPLFFLLTNSRSLPVAQAEWLNEQIGSQLVRTHADVPFVVVSRSDSTLRGHYPEEVLALQRGLGQTFDGHLIVPAFFEGGRYTIGDTHWVATPEPTSPSVVPASSTPFAKDPVFGYTTAHLPSWVAEKSRGRWTAEQVESVTLATVRQGPTAVCRRLQDVQGGVPVVVNAASYGDLAVFVLGLLEAEGRGKRFLYRTAASFVRLRAGLAPRPLLGADAIFAQAPTVETAPHGLVVVGSHVPASSAQLEQLLRAAVTEGLPIEPIELNVPAILSGASAEGCGEAIEAVLRGGRLPVLFTSRALVSAASGHEDNLAIGRRVMQALLAALEQIQTRPRYVVAKGGITSHELARRGFGARRATALGQVLPGVPVWRLEAGRAVEATRFPGLPYIVFPGNVGGPDALLQLVRLLG